MKFEISLDIFSLQLRLISNACYNHLLVFDKMELPSAKTVLHQFEWLGEQRSMVLIKAIRPTYCILLNHSGILSCADFPALIGQHHNSDIPIQYMKITKANVWLLIVSTSSFHHHQTWQSIHSNSTEKWNKNFLFVFLPDKNRSDRYSADTFHSLLKISINLF